MLRILQSYFFLIRIFQASVFIVFITNQCYKKIIYDVSNFYKDLYLLARHKTIKMKQSWVEILSVKHPSCFSSMIPKLIWIYIDGLSK